MQSKFLPSVRYTEKKKLLPSGTGEFNAETLKDGNGATLADRFFIL